MCGSGVLPAIIPGCPFRAELMHDTATLKPVSGSHVVVVGAGWGGWGASKALCEAGVRVTLIDGMADPTGRTPDFTASGKPFEAGTRGFWKDYPNINALTAELGGVMCSPHSSPAPSGPLMVWRPLHRCSAMAPSCPAPWVRPSPR